jgi:hypothetical protein
VNTVNARKKHQAKLRKTSGGGRYTPPARARTAVLSTGLGLLALTQASPALAAEQSAGLTWTRADGRRPAQDDARLSGTVQLAADVSTAEPVDGWSLTVLDEAAGPAFGSVCEKHFPRPRDSFRLECDWVTTRGAEGQPSANRRYLVRVSTLQGGALTPAGPDRPVALANPAAAPGNATFTYDPADRRVALAWAANREPDVLHYGVEENVDGRGWVRVGNPTGTAFDRILSEGGDHRYRVAAERRGPDGRTLGPGAWTTPKDGRRDGHVDPESSRSPSRRGTTRRDAEDSRRPSDRTSPEPSRTAERRSPDSPGQEPSRSGRRRPADSSSRQPSHSPGRRPADNRDGSQPADHRPAEPSRPEPSPPADPQPAGSEPSHATDPQPTDPQPTGPAGPDRSRSAGRRPAHEARRSPSKSADDSGRAGRPPADAPPADRSPVTFPPSSADAFSTLRAPAPAPKTAVPKVAATRPAVAPEPDTGFQERLPYPTPHAGRGPQPTAPNPTGDDPAGTAAHPVAEDGSGPETAASETAATIPGAPRRQNHRRQGTGLLVVAAGLLATAVKPIPRKRSPRQGPKPAMPTVPAAGPAPAAPASEATGPDAPPEPVEITALRQRVAQLEALLEAPAGPAPTPAVSSKTGSTWYAELF